MLSSESRLLRRIQPGGVILFARNLTSLEALRELIADVHGQAPGALLYLDAEGGRVDRLRKLVAPAPAAARLASVAPSLAGSAGRWVGRALRACGFDADFAPVVDLDRGAHDNALDGRTFGAKAATVVPLCHDLESAADAARRLSSRSLSTRREQALGRARAWRRHLKQLRKGRRVYALETIRRELATLEKILGGA